MSTQDPRDQELDIPPVELTRSACAPPRRHPAASRLDKSRAFALLFGEPVGPVKIGRFTLLEPVGSGSMGEVYAAYDEQLDRKVALKLVREERSSSPLAEERLLREAQTLARLSHPNVVHIYEIGHFEGRVFIAMEFVRGQSLRTWLQEHARIGNRVSQRQVLRQFMAAGRGLQAAHAAGLVHRDFKPDNVQVGDDGRPRVVDFGLARVMAVARAPALAKVRGEARVDPLQGDTWPVDDDSLAPPPVEHALHAARALTMYGQIMGTPRYMSPEQIRGESADHRSDQFSFCVALYEALYRQPPFVGDSLDELLRAIEKGAHREPPRGSDVPAPLRRALVRGLSAEPADRFPDMDALLGALREWPRQRWLRWLMTAVMAVTLIGGALLYIFTRESAESPCAGVGQTVADVWAPKRKAEIHGAFRRTGVTYAEASWNATAKHIDAYVPVLEREVVSACEASHQYGSPVRDFWYPRMSCLADGEQRLEALVAALERADATTVMHAYGAALELPDPKSCQSSKMPRGDLALPPAEKRASVQKIRAQLARSHTWVLLGQHEEALRIARSQLEPSRTLGYDPVHAEALFQIGRILIQEGTPAVVEEGERRLQEAGNLALRTRHDLLVAESWNLLVLSAIRHHSDTVAAHERYDRASAFIARIDAGPRYQADLQRNLGRLAYREGRFQAAEKHQREALRLLQKTRGAEPLLRALYLHDLGSTLRDLSRYSEAQEKLEEALALHADLGAAHPYVVDLRIDIAMLHATRGDLATAGRLLAEILQVDAVLLGKQHPTIGRAHLELAEVHRQRGALDLAMMHVMTAVDIYEATYGATHDKLADVYARLGPIAYRRGSYEEALAAYEKARALMVRYRGETHLDTGLAQVNIAETQVALGHHDEALETVAQAELILAPYSTSYDGIAPLLASVRGRALRGKGEVEAAARVLESAARGFEALPRGSMDVERADAYWALVQALSALGRGKEPATRKWADAAFSVYDAVGAETSRDAVRHWLRVSGRAN
jgi:tetratricopeptide (TPR) repeat protein/tRNA A-37 threonylcarbamoyl transferase component Bud32